MGKDDDYYDDYYIFYNYKDDLTMTSIQPGENLLYATVGYTGLCLIIGLFYKIRKKKWRKKKQQDSFQVSTSVNETDQKPNTVINISKSQDEDYESDNSTVESEGSSKAYELMFGPYDDFEAKDTIRSHEKNKSKPLCEDLSYQLYVDNINEESIDYTRNRNGDDMDDTVIVVLSKPPSTDTDDESSTKESTSSDGRNENFYFSNSGSSDPGARKKTKKWSPRSLKKNQTGSIGSYQSPSPFFRRNKKDKNTDVEKKVMADADIFSSPIEQNENPEIEMKKMSNKNSSELDQYLENNNNLKNSSDSSDSSDSSVIPNDLDTAKDIVDRSEEGDDTFGNEMRQINALATPWTISSFISDFASIVTIALISNYMSVAEMICYSYVWFIIGAAFILPSALYSSSYKHVNNAIASETEEGCFKAGKYIRISVIINTILSIPIGIAVIFGMEYILRLYGFADQMVQLSFGYTIIAVIHQVTSSTSGFMNMTVDIDGYADFNAKFTFFDAAFDICLSFFVIPFLRPSLLQLGLIHYAHEILASIVYYYLTLIRWGWYDNYKEGMLTSLNYDRQDKKAFATLVKKTVPMFFDELNGELEWLVTSYFASSLGTAQSASWILLSYIWDLIDVVPANIGSAAEYRISNQLSKGNILLAQQISSRCMILTGVTSLIGNIVMYCFRDPLTKAMVSDDGLAESLMNVIPYIVLCQPLVVLSSFAGYVNSALAMYKRATIIELSITCLVGLPLSWISTYHFGWDITGLTAAAFISDATMGAVAMAIYKNADWDKAVRKNRKIAGLEDLSKRAKGELV